MFNNPSLINHTSLISMNMWKHSSRQISLELMHVFRENSSNINHHNIRYLATRLSPQKWEKPKGFDTGIMMYHPLVKEKVSLILQHENLIKWYACGPTVYDSAHIGHASSYVRQDVIRRILKSHFNIDSVLLMGITDLDDKIIRRSNELAKPFKHITSLYETEFLNDLTKLNVLPPSMLVRVTEHLPHIINFIDGIMQKGFAYIASDGSVYFDLGKYSQLEKQSVFSEREINRPGDSQSSEADDASVKKHVQDFALWKASKPQEPSWDSPWGKGRPGWHIECSAMASSIFGCNFDLHSGGEDLIFPHHECEVVQSCIYHDVNQWANYWIHTGHLFIPGQEDKMSKSLKNVISVSEVLENYTPNQFRMLCLLTSYRKQIEFSSERMAKAVATLKVFQSLVTRCNAYVEGQVNGNSIPEAEMFQQLDTAKKAVRKAFLDDFNTPQALARVVRLVKSTNQLLMDDNPKQSLNDSTRSPAVIASINSFVQDVLKDLGIAIGGATKDSPSLQEELQFHKLMDIAVLSRDKIRNMAKNKKAFLESAAELEIPKEKASKLLTKWAKPLWDTSDEIRDEILTNTNVQINDGMDKSTWSVVERAKKADPDP